MEIFSKIGAFFSHGTVFQTTQQLYQKEATEMESNEILVSVQKAHFPVTDYKLSGFIQRQIGSTMEIFSKIGAFFSHGTVFQTTQQLYQKEATGMESLIV